MSSLACPIINESEFYGVGSRVDVAMHMSSPPGVGSRVDVAMHMRSPPCPTVNLHRKWRDFYTSDPFAVRVLDQRMNGGARYRCTWHCAAHHRTRRNIAHPRTRRSVAHCRLRRGIGHHCSWHNVTHHCTLVHRRTQHSFVHRRTRRCIVHHCTWRNVVLGMPHLLRLPEMVVWWWRKPLRNMEATQHIHWWFVVLE